MTDFVTFSVGWVVGEVKSKAISAFNQVEVKVEAKLGKSSCKLGLRLIKTKMTKNMKNTS